MKIQGPSETQKAGKSKGASKTGKTSGAFDSMLTGGAEKSASAGATSSIAAVDALLAVQAADDPTERAARKRTISRADTLLDELEKLKLGLLTGSMTIGQVINVADVVASHREKVNDPALTGVLDEIDLRAQIEIAKMKKSIH